MNRVYSLFISSLNIDSRWNVLITSGPEYEDELTKLQNTMSSPSKTNRKSQTIDISAQVQKNLDTIKWNIDQVH